MDTTHSSAEVSTKAEHTPTPWKVNIVSSNEMVIIEDSVGDKSLAAIGCNHEDGRNLANANFIVTACNEHDKLKSDKERLVEALKAEHEAYMEIAESNAHGRSCATCELLAEIEGQ